MQLRHFLLIFSALAALPACDGHERTSIEVKNQLKVWGPQNRVARFAKLQGSENPPLAVSALKPLGNGQAEATVKLPTSYKAKDLISTTRKALDAGLSYSFEGSQSETVVRSVK